VTASFRDRAASAPAGTFFRETGRRTSAAAAAMCSANSVKRCAVARTGQAAATGTTIAPRLRADCDIDLITVFDRAAKQ